MHLLFSNLPIHALSSWARITLLHARINICHSTNPFTSITGESHPSCRPSRDYLPGVIFGKILKRYTVRSDPRLARIILFDVCARRGLIASISNAFTQGSALGARGEGKRETKFHALPFAQSRAARSSRLPIARHGSLI